jgi:hypothetical protein
LFYRRPTVGNQVFAVDISTASGVAFSNERPLNIRGFSIDQFFRDYDIMRDGRFVMLFPEGLLCVLLGIEEAVAIGGVVRQHDLLASAWRGDGCFLNVLEIRLA